MTNTSISIILPCLNEGSSLASILPELQRRHPTAEIIVVNDGSSDNTEQVVDDYGLTCITHPYSMGNGTAIKSGARHAQGDIAVFMDADGQHNPADIECLLAKLGEGYDMVVGARKKGSQANLGRGFANRFYNKLASLMTGHKIDDLTSGFRAVRRNRFLEFIHLLPNGFSYPTTITMAFFRAGYPVAYIPIHARKRIGKSHVRILRDGFRFILIIFKVGTLYSPLKLFVPLSLFFFLSGCGHYLYTFFTEGRFTNMSALMLSTSVIVFLVGLVSEQITSLIYRK